QNPVKPTTYSFTRSYGGTGTVTHEATGVDNTKYRYDADGNFLGVLDAKGKWIRQNTYDATDRLRNVNDGSTSTDYSYDDLGERVIERGPSGETAFINPWVT